MNKILAMLLMVATVIGMVVPAMANPQKPIAVAENEKDMNIKVDGALTAASTITQTQDVKDLSNWALGIGTGGNLNAASTAVGIQAVGNVDSLGGCNSGNPTARDRNTANGGVPAGGNGGDDNLADHNSLSGNGGNSDANAAALSAANAVGGNNAGDCSNKGAQVVTSGPAGNDNLINGPEGFSGDNIQTNAVTQTALAAISTTQRLDQPVTIFDIQASVAIDPATQTYIDSLLTEELHESDTNNIKSDNIK